MARSVKNAQMFYRCLCEHMFASQCVAIPKSFNFKGKLIDVH